MGVEKPVLPENCFFLLGKTDLSKEETGSVNSSVSRFVSHPEWNPFIHRRNADIAIAVLTNSVEYSVFVSSICLYNSNSDQLFSKTGTISGWGATETNPQKHSDVAMETNGKIASTLRCVLENPEFVHLISETALCVMNGNGTGACAGIILKNEESGVLRYLICLFHFR